MNKDMVFPISMRRRKTVMITVANCSHRACGGCNGLRGENEVNQYGASI